jgi:hypothetical protein
VSRTSPDLAAAAPVPAFDAATASRFAEIALANVERAFPNKPDHVLADAGDALPPRAFHPSFYGSYDWHSSVHMHWLLVRARRLHPMLPQRRAIDAVLERHFDASALLRERAYLARPDAATFERTYGWAWLLELARELRASADPAARRWSIAMQPLADAFVTRYCDYLARADHPLRYGVHSNSAFGLAFALDYAAAAGARELAHRCRERARRWFLADRDAPAAWEPSGADFLSPVLAEADAMRRVCAPDEFAAWLHGFLPGLADRQPATLFEPVAVSDRSDAQIVHLDGLNLSRAWHWRNVAGALSDADPRRGVAAEAAAAHLAAGLAGVATGHYVGTHWLARFATLALTEPDASRLLHSPHDQ